MVNLSPDKKRPKRKKDRWYVKLTGLFGGLLPFIFGVGVLIYWLPILWNHSSYNAKCDKLCVAAGYPAGESMPPTRWKHKACICWPATAGPAGHILLERDD